MKQISLTKGLLAIVDDDMLEELSKFKWHAGGHKNKEYAVRKSYSCVPPKTVYMHQQVLGYYAEELYPFIVDHINRNRLDNRRDNLRVASYHTNINNSANGDKYRGVGYDSRHKAWKAYTRAPRKNLGTFKTEQEALEAVERHYSR